MNDVFNFSSKVRLTAILTTVTGLLLLPLIAMLFTHGVNWSPADFIIAAVLLFGSGLTCEFVLRKVKKLSHRILICGAVLLVLFLTWAELAVGIFGTPLAGS